MSGAYDTSASDPELGVPDASSVKDMETSGDLAVLAPVPLTHLVDGADVCKRNGRVAYGSRAYDVFAELDSLRGGLPVEVLIYASHAEENVGPQATWKGRYIGFTPALLGGRHPQGDMYRPPSTQTGEDDAGHWLLFWELDRLEHLDPDDWVEISGLRDRRRRRPYGQGFVPQGPIVISPP